MAVDRSELSSLAALLAQLTERVAAMGETCSSAHQDEDARELFAIERALVGAKRRLDRLVTPRH